MKITRLAQLEVPGFPRLEVPRLGLAAFRRRIIVRGVFLLLALATLALSVVVLQEEKERSYRNYENGFRKTQAEIAARLRHPAGQLALLNPGRSQQTQPLRPLMLPYAALDFDDQYKASQAAETAGCTVQYPDGSALCVAVGHNPYAGGFIYLVGSFKTGPLVARERGQLDLHHVHRARVSVRIRGQTLDWLAPFEWVGGPPDTGAGASVGAVASPAVSGRLTGFQGPGPALSPLAKPVRDFRGWLWQNGTCDSAADQSDGCARRTHFSIRLPIEAYRQALFTSIRPIWPPADLDQTQVHLQLLGPPPEPILFDSNAPGATAPLALNDVTQTLLPGETLHIRKASPAQPTGAPNAPIVPIASIGITLRGAGDPGEVSSPWLSRLIGILPVAAVATPDLVATDRITTAAGIYEVRLSGNVRSVEQSLSATATRMAWYVGAMQSAILLAWLLIEFGLLRQVKVLTRRAAAVSYNVNAAQVDERLGALEVDDLRGKDELGILAGALADLLQRVKDDVKREHIRAAQERDMWHAVGHEIMSPLQSLMVLHPSEGDTSHRYVQRMQQAVNVLYGQATPSEALAQAALPEGTLDLHAFLQHVAANAHYAGLDAVQYNAPPGLPPVTVRADEFALEDVITHVLRNADRHRTPGSPISLSLQTTDNTATVTVHNQGLGIEPTMLTRIFEYGVSGAPQQGAPHAQRRGQGLFVAKTYMAKMGGTIEARNQNGGVELALVLLRVAGT